MTVQAETTETPKQTTKLLEKMTLRELIEAYNTLNAGQAPVKASFFANKADAIKRISALKRKIRRTKAPATGTIREYAETLLRTPRKYSEILMEVQSAFPDCKTSRSSLRWYAAQMRGRGESLPQRELDI